MQDRHVAYAVLDLGSVDGHTSVDWCQSGSHLQDTAAWHATDFTAQARLRRVSAELEAMRGRRRELAAVRLQRWLRACHWRRWLLPLQLERARVLLRSCRRIQQTWRGLQYAPLLHGEASRWRSESVIAGGCLNPCLASGNPLSMDRIYAMQQQLDSHFSANSEPVSRTEMHHDDEHVMVSRGISGMEPQGEMVRLCEPRPASTGIEGPNSLRIRPMTSVCVVTDVGDQENPMMLDKEEVRQAAALWRGYRVRRAFQARSVQSKLQQRHDTYLLITDAEAPANNSKAAATRQREGVLPWLDVLYAGMARLQEETLVELEAALPGGSSSPWGGARCSPTWRGWPHDLQRMPGLATGRTLRRNLSMLASEPSLLACTSLQLCTPPRSPALGPLDTVSDAREAAQHLIRGASTRSASVTLDILERRRGSSAGGQTELLDLGSPELPMDGFSFPGLVDDCLYTHTGDAPRALEQDPNSNAGRRKNLAGPVRRSTASVGHFSSSPSHVRSARSSLGPRSPRGRRRVGPDRQGLGEGPPEREQAWQKQAKPPSVNT